MTDWTPILIPTAAGFTGVLVGTFLRPVVEEWFANRRKTLHVQVLDNSSEFVPPHNKMTIDWYGDKVDKIIQTGFRIKNRTGRTIRNFTLEIGAEGEAGDTGVFEVYLEPSGRARFTETESDDFGIFKFDFIEPGVTLEGSMVSNYSREIEFRALGDIELRRISTVGSSRWDFWGALITGAAASALAGAIASVVGI